MEEGDRWFHIEQERRRDKKKLADRARSRAIRATQREEQLQRAFNTTPNAKMTVTGWEVDEQGNLSRKIYSE